MVRAQRNKSASRSDPPRKMPITAINPTVSAQSTTAHIAPAIAQLKAKLGHDAILHSGQFAWANMYLDNLKSRVLAVIPPSHGLHAQVVAGSTHAPSRLDRILVACVARDRAQFDALRNDLVPIVDSYLAAHPGDPGTAWVKRLLREPLRNAWQRANTGWKGFPMAEAAVNNHDAATAYFSQGHNFAPGSPERTTYFPESQHGFSSCFEIYLRAQERCSTLAVNMGLFLYARHWRHDQRLSAAKKPPVGYVRTRLDTRDPDDHFDTGASPAVSGLGQLIPFSGNLSNFVQGACRALDLGFLLTANVISGVRKDGGAPGVESEHSITLIGHDTPLPGQITLAFWDPDAVVSNGEFGEDGLGVLYFDSADRCRRSPAGPQHQNGRLTTAMNDRDLLVDRRGDHLEKLERHRYQVISIAYVRR